MESNGEEGFGSEGLREEGARERESWALRRMSESLGDRSPIPVRPVRAELAQTGRNKFELVICRLSFELITVVNLIISN